MKRLCIVGCMIWGGYCCAMANGAVTEVQVQKEITGLAQDIETRITIVGGCLLGVIALSTFVLYRKIDAVTKGQLERGRKIDKVIDTLTRITNDWQHMGAAKKQAQSAEKGYVVTVNTINTIVDQVLECLRLDNEERNKPSEKVEKPQIRSYKYLKGKSGKRFSRAESSPENSFFRIFQEADEFSYFEFTGNQEEALSKKVFQEDICSIESGSASQATRVETIKPGRVKKIGDEWEVIESITIKLI